MRVYYVWVGKTKIIIIGGGIGGLASACLLARDGYDVTLLEKNEQVGGRAFRFKEKGFTFDGGPSWYLMPDVFEHFFELIDEPITDHLKLKKLSPSYRVFYKDSGKTADIYSDFSRDKKTFERLEKGSAKALKNYLEMTAYQYAVAKRRFLYKNYDSLHDFFNREMFTHGRKLGVWRSMHRQVRKYFKLDELQKIMLYPLVFLGSNPYNAPAVYSLLNHVDLGLGVYYPKGGVYSIIVALEKLAKKYGVKIKLKSPVKRIMSEDSLVSGVELKNGKIYEADIVVSNADRHHTEHDLLEPENRSFSDKFWQKRTLAPSALLIYLGVKGQLPNLTHHNLLFSRNWKQNFKEIFDEPTWPTDPSFYICNPTKTDKSLAPADHESLFVMVPVAPALSYTKKQLETYADKVIQTMESNLKLKGLRDRVVYKRLFSVKDFSKRYNSYQGTALGLAHTWDQTAVFRPSNASKKLSNLYFVGADTTPGIGMPTCLISAELVYKRIIGNYSEEPLPKI